VGVDMISVIRSLSLLIPLFLFSHFSYQAETIDIQGSLYNASNEAFPADIIVTLLVENQSEVMLKRTDILFDGNHYEFKNIQLNPDWEYSVSVIFEGVKFTSQIIRGDEIVETNQVDLPITVYSSTTSDATLFAERVHVFMNFSQPGVLRITELYTIMNSGIYVIIPDEERNSKLQFTLPTGAINLQVQNEDLSSVIVETDYGFYELVYIYPLPVQHQILFRYDLPYENTKTIRFIMPMDIKTAVLAVPQKDVTVESERLVPTGTRLLEGEPMQLFMINDLQKGEVVPITVTGQPRPNAGIGEPSTQHLIISIVFFVPIFVLFFVWLINNHQKLRKKKQRINDMDYEKQTILDEIVALDDLYRSNQLAVDVYKNRRNELLLVLKELLIIRES
jgi:hypothetical protein